MTTATEHPPAPQGGIRQSMSDSLIITGRNLRRIPRIPELAIFAIIQSIMFVLLFAFVFGGAIAIPGFPDPNAYREYLLPGHLRPDHRLRGGDRGDRHVRRHQQGHHRPLPLAADVAIGGPDRPDVLGSRLQRGHPGRPDAGRPGRRLVGPHGPRQLPGRRGPAPGLRLCDGLARRLAGGGRADRGSRAAGRRSPCSSRSRSSRACSSRSTPCRPGCSPSPTGTR